jgi:hypothetical protein
MQNLVLLCAIIVWVYVLVNPLLGNLSLFVWIVAFILIKITWTKRYALISLTAAISYHFSDWSHLNPFYSKIFPFICGMSSFILIIGLLFKLLANVNGSGGSGYMGSGGSDVGGGCDSGGCGGGE